MRLLSICFNCASVIPSLLRAASNASCDSILLSFLIDSSTCVELRVADREPHLLRALHQQHLIDHGDDGLRGDLREELGQLGIGQAARVGLVRQLAKRRELNPVKLGLRDDFAVHLHEHLLEDLGGNGSPQDGDGQRSE